MPSASNWQSLGADGLYGTLTTTGGGGNTSARDALDYRRMGSPGQTPEAQYPDGYLQASNGRREDKLAKGINDLNTRPYTRGVHKGEKIAPGDYLWPDDQKPDRGLRNEARGMKTGLSGQPPVRLVNDGKSMPLMPMNADFSSLRTPWR